MINLEEQFSPRVNPADANYPFGSIKDNTSPGANYGTPLAAVWGNDWEGFAQAAMTEAGITPSGLPDTAQDSQLLEAVKFAAGAPVSREALRRSYAEAGYNLVQGSFEKGGVLTSTSDVLLHEASGIAYSGPLGNVAPGTDPTAVTGYVQHDSATLRDQLSKSAVRLADYNPPQSSYDGSTITGADATTQFTQALHDAQTAGVALDLGCLKFRLSSGTVAAIPGASVIITGVIGQAEIYVDNWSAKANTDNHGLLARTLITAEMDGQAAVERKSDFIVTGVRLINTDTSATTRCINAQAMARKVIVQDCAFIGFTVAGVFGAIKYESSLHQNSDAVTTLDSADYYRVLVISDSKSTGQCPKAFHTYQCMSTNYLCCELYGHGDGYVVRNDGGHFDTIPVAGRGSNNVKMALCFVYSESASEYCQATKTVGVAISCNTADASKGVMPDNFWDLFNCFGVTFNGNTVRGGGLLFHGHADLNFGSHPESLIGSHTVSATGNTLINPSHDSVFNFGGDGTVDGNRAFRNAVISGNTVYCEPGYTPPRPVAFFYGFLCNGVKLSGNNVKGINTYVKTFYCKDISVDGETLDAVPQEIENLGNDTWVFKLGRVLRLNGSGNTSRLDRSNVFSELTNGDSGFSQASVVLEMGTGSDFGAHEIDVVSIAYFGSAKYGKYIVVTSGSSVMEVVTVHNNPDVSLTITPRVGAPTIISVNNVTGNNRVLRVNGRTMVD